MMQALLMSVLCLASFALMANPNRPDLPERPQTPAERQMERQAERQLERAMRQLENLPERLPEPAAAAVERASERIAERQFRQVPQPRAQVSTARLAQRRVEVMVEHDFQAIEREWVLLLSQNERQQLQQQAAWLLDYLVAEQHLAALDSQLLTLQLPPELDSHQALTERLSELKPPGLDRNHIYRLQSGNASARTATVAARQEAALCQQPATLGLIDTAIDRQHPQWQQRVRFQSQSFVAEELEQPLSHGTAVASRLTQQFDQPLTVYHAAVFYQDKQQRQGTTLQSLLQALNWQAQQGVQVINMSLTGPDNQALRRAIEQLWQGSTYLVAAVGNAGPQAQPLYPAAYPEVLAVTAVNEQMQLYRWAVQGEHIAFAAAGDQVMVADSQGGYRLDSGTSLAAPVAAAWLACALAETGDYTAALAQLKRVAIPAPGPHNTAGYGYGVLPGRQLGSEAGLQ
ncbi:S8 family serine peptidase [Alkalimonas amylolytica]|uniref:Subtilase family protein n=1 Tax=Alkalimonas amylolytica TaxID=152573 RepID=A0A1H3WZF5_ALKAM|nr:S8 family serine peptidase [Alkalimonas amylolytica]SDZ92340.1 Subtilase family protein [Alkalimonas amylolytica]